MHRFSPSGQYLGVGSEEGTVDFYDISKGPQLQREGYCKGISGFVAQMDFSADSKYIKVAAKIYLQTCKAYSWFVISLSLASQHLTNMTVSLHI